MTKILYALVAALFTLTVVRGAEAEKEDGVFVLDAFNFDEEVAKHEFLMVEFYAPWCGHCKKLAPEYAAAAQILAEQETPRYLAKVDVDGNDALGERFRVSSFPTLLWFVDGKHVEYKGGRTKDSILAFINKRSGFPSFELSCEDLQDGKASVAKLNLVYFGDKEGSLYNEFLSVAKVNEKFQFFHASGECAHDHQAKHNSLAIFRTFDKSPVHYNGELSQKAITSWMEKVSLPTLIEFSAEYVQPVFKSTQPSLILFSNDKDAAYNAVFKEAAHALEGEIIFVTSGNQNGLQKRLAEFSNVEANMLPTIRILQPGETMEKYIYQGKIDEISVASIKQFIDEFKTGKVNQFLKSEPELEDHQGQLMTLVGTTYNKVTQDAAKDVFVFIYAPWCQHCQNLAPAWDELAAFAAENDNLVIARFNAAFNEVEGLRIKDLPSLRLYPKGSDQFIEYEEQPMNDFNSFKEFLAEHSSAFRSQFDKAPSNEDL